MDYRTESIIKRFTSVKRYLNADSINNIISIKYREDCVNSSDYSRLINDFLKHETMLNIKELDRDFQGHAWLIKDKNQDEVILVEHETGLEILYIAGSIASLIALIPLINTGWRYLRNGFHHREGHHDKNGNIEIRKLNSQNTLIEQNVQNIETYILNISMEENAKINQKLIKIENEIRELKKLTTDRIIKSKNNKRNERKM
jgi:hypothetical protein